MSILKRANRLPKWGGGFLKIPSQLLNLFTPHQDLVGNRASPAPLRGAGRANRRRRRQKLITSSMVGVVGFEPTKPSTYKTDALTAELHARL